MAAIERAGQRLLPTPQPLAGLPCVVLRRSAQVRMRLPCFCVGAQVGMLPAFDEFAGMRALRHRAGERIFVVQGEQVRALPTRP